MHSRQRAWQVGAAAIVLIAVSVLSGCSKSGSGSASKSDSASSKSSSKDGKTYTSDSKGGGSKAGSSGNGGSSNAVLPTPADTTNNKASAASDAGYESAIEGQASMTPGAPVYPPSQKQSKSNQH
jgi:hypothetical protein